MSAAHAVAVAVVFVWLGLVVAISFIADVAIAYLEEHDDAIHTADLIEAAGRRCVRLPGDLAQAEQCRAVVQRTVDALGGLDVLVNNVAFQHPVDDFTEITDEQWRRTFSVNIDSFFYVTKAAVPHLLSDGGAIVKHRRSTGCGATRSSSTTRPRKVRCWRLPTHWHKRSQTVASGSTAWRPARCGRR
jgi:NAD(P)-dependent dehydrogenase (short-subunit alcohol dehydrogenase family)